jgi:cellulose synthase/poly-beta-1,6-N-acetylglucosamine synthase-like glycosyltransferase
MRRLTITGVICTDGNTHLLPQAINSLCKQAIDRERFHLCVVDNSSGTVPMCLPEAFSSWPVDVLREAVVGLSNARNAALRVCNSDVIAFMDDDALADAGWLGALLQAFEEEAHVGAAGGRVTGMWGHQRPHWLPSSKLGFLSLVDWGSERCELFSPRWLAGTNIAFSTETLRKVGGFRTDLGRRGGGLLGNEELDATARVRAAGMRVVYEPNAVVQHLIPPERLTHKWFRRRAFWQAISDLIAQDDRHEEMEGGLFDEAPRLIGSLAPKLWADFSDPAAMAVQLDTIQRLVVSLAAGAIHRNRGTPTRSALSCDKQSR